MHIVEVNRGVRRPFYLSFLFTVIFILFISGHIIFVTINNKEDTEFNTEYNEDKWLYPMDDDVTETVTFTNNLPPKKYLPKTSPTDYSMYVIFGYICLAIVISVIICIMYECCPKVLCRLNPFRPVGSQSLVNFDRNHRVRIPLY